MSFSKEERRLIHKKAQQPLMGNGVPSNLDGKDNDIAYRRISNKGIVHYVKRDGEWQALSSTDSLPSKRGVTRATTTTSGGTSSSVTDHGSMSGLTHDDHAHYLLINGTRAMTGGLSISGDAALNFTASGENSIRIPDNQGSALIIEEAGNAYLTFNTANSGEKITLGKKLEAGSVEIEGTAFDINGGTVDAITSLTVANNVDIGNYKITSKALEASDLTSGRVTFAGANGLLSDNSDFTFSTDTLTVTKIGAFEATGAIDFSDENMTNVDIDSGAIDAVTLGTNSAVTEAQIDNININGYIISTANSQTLSVSGGELKLIANQAGTDDAGDNRIRFVDNTTAFGDIKYDDGDTLRLSSASSTDIELYTAGEQINFISASGTMIFNIDATPEIDVTGNFSIDCSADITLDAAGNDIKFQAGATHELKFTNSSGSWLAAPQTSNANLTFSPNGTGDVICKLGNDAATSTFVVENSSATDRFVVDALGAVVITQASTAANPALKIDSADVDVIGVDINGSQTTANVVDVTSTSATTGNILNITSGALTTGNAIYINHDDSHTEDETVVSFHLDFDKSGVMDDGETGTYTGFDIDMNDASTNHASSTVTMTGIDMDVVTANAQGTLTNLGASFTVTGADTNNGLEITTTDGGTDLKIMSSADSGDYFSIATTTHGATTFTTVDDDAAAANIQITADGTAELAGTTITLDSSGDIVLDAAGDDIYFKDAGSERFRMDLDDTPTLAVTGAFTLDCSDDIEFNADGGNFVFSDGGQQSLNLFVDTGGNVGDAVFKDAGDTEIFRIDGSENSVRFTGYGLTNSDPYAVSIKPLNSTQHMTMGLADKQNNYSMIGIYSAAAASISGVSIDADFEEYWS